MFHKSYCNRYSISTINWSIRSKVHLLLVPFVTNINQFPCLILLQPLELATIAIPKYLIQVVAHIRGLVMIQIQLRGNPLGIQHLCNFNAAHDLTKGSTAYIDHKELLVDPLAIISNKWHCSQLNHLFQNPYIACSIHTWIR